MIVELLQYAALTGVGVGLALMFAAVTTSFRWWTAISRGLRAAALAALVAAYVLAAPFAAWYVGYRMPLVAALAAAASAIVVAVVGTSSSRKKQR